MLASLAELARSRNYVRPTVVAEPVLDIDAGRHPVLDITEPAGTFVPKDVQLRGRGAETRTSRTNHQLILDPRGSLLLITGPNMAGKSTYIRQAALLTLMAQIGSFVPARRATIGVADRIFARVGASDELSRGQSTFMVEMTETARILNTATRAEPGDPRRDRPRHEHLRRPVAGLGIVEHLHDAIGCRTLFATHYHELTDLAEQLAGVRNFNVAVKEWDDQVVFLHQIVPGAADKSYGIHVAQLAGVPRSVNERAREVLDWLEAQHQAADGAAAKSCASAQRSIGRRRWPAPIDGHWQMTLFGIEEHPLLDEIRAANLDELDAARSTANCCTRGSSGLPKNRSPAKR